MIPTDPNPQPEALRLCQPLTPGVLAVQCMDELLNVTYPDPILALSMQNLYDLNNFKHIFLGELQYGSAETGCL